MQVVRVRCMPGEDFHRIGDALAGATDEIRVVLLAYADCLGLREYSQTLKTLENRPEVHRRPRRVDDLPFGFDDGEAYTRLCETESSDEADWSATDDYHIFHKDVPSLYQSADGPTGTLRCASGQ